MPRIPINLNSLICPDYTLELFQDTRVPLVNDNTTHDQAAVILTNIWTASNTAEQLLWQLQVSADEDAAEALRQQDRKALALKEAEAAKEKEDQHKEERKRNLGKFLPIPDRPVPHCPPVIASQSATRRMDKGDCVPLWYYTNKGLENALSTYNSTDDDALSLLRGLDGLTSLIPASSTKESKGVIEDQDLDWEDFCIAAPWMIEAMGRASWPPERIQMMSNFWANLQEHLFRSSGAPFEQKALLLYQAEQHRLWHIAINTPHAGYNLSNINNSLLRDTKDQLFWKERTRSEADRDPPVSSLPNSVCLTTNHF
ncbi:hypothetical protein PILCRDRAFT_10994 [Piloderma croceum F 1598]|uniref:Uncharacterized protein n=1 Tax=Piloderma croceum (strain F 1598) TaxID=765440 RepID=A0A0C3FFP3_PILCF|nr:hypothetical protein PILCRDRAFT_10994 [Piloderma croceum F 1598]